MRGEALVGERERQRYILDPDELDYIEAQGNYVQLHAGALTYISRDSLKRLAALLAPRGFVRIERSLLINARMVVQVQRATRGNFTFTLTGGVRLRSGGTYRGGVRRAFPGLARGGRGRRVLASTRPAAL
jgi:two-component system, LytTR family, response regulator